MEHYISMLTVERTSHRSVSTYCEIRNNITLSVYLLYIQMYFLYPPAIFQSNVPHLNSNIMLIPILSAQNMYRNIMVYILTVLEKS